MEWSVGTQRRSHNRDRPRLGQRGGQSAHRGVADAASSRQLSYAACSITRDLGHLPPPRGVGRRRQTYREQQARLIGPRPRGRWSTTPYPCAPAQIPRSHPLVRNVSITANGRCSDFKCNRKYEKIRAIQTATRLFSSPCLKSSTAFTKVAGSRKSILNLRSAHALAISS